MVKLKTDDIETFGTESIAVTVFVQGYIIAAGAESIAINLHCCIIPFIERGQYNIVQSLHHIGNIIDKCTCMVRGYRIAVAGFVEICPYFGLDCEVAKACVMQVVKVGVFGLAEREEPPIVVSVLNCHIDEIAHTIT